MNHKTTEYSFRRHALFFWVFLVSCVHCGCTTNSLVLRLPEDAQDEVFSVITQESTASLVTVIYSPEWEDLDIIERRLVEDQLRCIVYRQIPYWEMNSLKGEIWYETSNRDDIADFLRLRDQLVNGTDVIAKPPSYSSNPTLRWHLHDDSGDGVLLTHPWSRRGAYWLAEQTILFSTTVNDGDISGSRVIVSDWVDPLEDARWELIDRRFQFIPAETYYASVFLDFFDLQQRLKWKFEQTDASSQIQPSS